MRITRENLDDTIKQNEYIQKSVKEHIAYVEKRINKWKSMPTDRQAYHILKEYQVIQVPIPDEDWGGVIRNYFNGFKLPIINTAQPRVYQYFIYWHEIYHLTEIDTPIRTDQHVVTIDFDAELNERKADYFASQVIFGESDLYDLFFQIKGANFMEKIAKCMDAYRAPYKAVLIELYGLAKRYDNVSLQRNILEYFDHKLTREAWVQLFQSLQLDDSLVKPTYTVDLSPLINAIEKKIELFPNVELYNENLKYVNQLNGKFLQIKKELSSSEA